MTQETETGRQADRRGGVLAAAAFIVVLSRLPSLSDTNAQEQSKVTVLLHVTMEI